MGQAVSQLRLRTFWGRRCSGGSGGHVRQGMLVWKSNWKSIEARNHYELDNVIENILKPKDHYKLVHNVNLVSEWMEDLRRQLNILVDELR